MDLASLSHFVHLANAKELNYSIFSLDGWHRLTSAQIIPVNPGDFIIIRASHLKDSDCVGLARLIRRYHREVEASSVGHNRLERYRLPLAYRRGRGDIETGHESDPTF